MLNKYLFLALLLLTLACSKSDEGVSTPELDPNELQNFIVVLKDEHVESQNWRAFSADNVKVEARAMVVDALAEVKVDYELGESQKIFSVVLKGGVYRLTRAEAAKLSEDQRIAYVEEDRVVHINLAQNSPPWGLDRIDQPTLPLNQVYNYPRTAENVNVYIIDTGILLSHQALKANAVNGFDAIDGGDATDCNGHGTHVAGTVASQLYGVAKAAKLFAVRVLDCRGSGTISDVVEGIEWVTQRHQKPAVANMSLGVFGSKAVDDAVAASIQSGVTYVVAAGNETDNACNYSPAKVPTAITVGATNSSDQKASFSNYGSCVSLFAPGQDVLSAWSTSTTATNTISGTSMASPHVAGIAALYLASNPNATPAQVKAALVAGSLSGRVSSPGSGSPNLLANIGFLSASNPPVPPVDPPPAADDLLRNNVARIRLNAVKGNEQFFRVEVPAGKSTLTVQISGGSGDADLYVKAGAKPTTGSYDCRPYINGNGETCRISVKPGAVYHVMLRAYSAYSNVSLRASF